MGGKMIGKISIGRIEPYFMAAKPAYGDLSRVKKESHSQNIILNSKTQKSDVDTFTSSKASNNNQNIRKSENKPQVTQ